MTIFGTSIQLNEIYMVAGMAIVTFAIRYIMFPITGRFQFPELFERGLRYVPPVVLTAIIIPSVLMPTGETINLKLSNPYLIGALTACAVGSRFDSVLAAKEHLKAQSFRVSV